MTAPHLSSTSAFAPSLQPPSPAVVKAGKEPDVRALVHHKLRRVGAAPQMDAGIPEWARHIAEVYFASESPTGLHVAARSIAQAEGLAARDMYNESVLLAQVEAAYGNVVIDSLGPVAFEIWTFVVAPGPCPVLCRRFNLVTKQDWVVPYPCKLSGCLSCAKEKVWRIEKQAAARFAVQGAMYYGTFPVPDATSLKSLTTFLTGRLSVIGKTNVGYLKFVRTGVAHIFSTKLLASRKKTISISWTPPLGPYKAMEVLHGLEHLPSRGVRHYWRGMWAPTPTQTSDSSDVVDFGPVRQTQWEDAKAHVRASLRDRGIDMRDLTPTQTRDLYALPLRAEIDRLRRLGKVTAETHDDAT